MIKILSHKIILIVFILSIYVSISFSQFSVVSTSPVNGSANIDTASTMSITFSAAIDTNASFHFPGGIFISMFFAPDSLVHEPDSITFSPDLHTVYFHNLHLEFTIYRFCILNAVSISGDSLDVPYSFTFATTSILPGFYATLSGTIDYPGSDPTGAIVFLFKSNPFEDEESRIENWAVVSNSSGMFTIDYVDSGFCWPAVIKDFFLDEDGEIQIQDGSKIGYFDHGGDLRPDSNYVFMGSTLTGFNMTLFNVYSQTARGPVTAVDLIAQGWQTDAQLIEFGGDELLPDGNAMFWQYTYYSQSILNSKIWLTAGDLIISIKDDSINSDSTALPSNWLDSDSIMVVAEANGGSNFRQQYPDAQVFGGCGYFDPDFGKFKKYDKQITQKSNISKAVWNIEYYSESTWQYLQLLIDAVTGTVLNIPVTAAETESAAFPIAQAWSMDVKLWTIENQGSPMHADGKTDYWICIYYSPQKDSLYAVDLWGLLPYWTGYAGWIPVDTTSIKPGWLNSDVTMGIAENNGGSDYRQNNQQVYVNAHLGQWVNSTYPDSIVWKFEYNSSTTGTLEIVIDAYSGDIINSIDKPENSIQPNSFRLYQNYPNPFNPKTNISFHLPKSADVNLTIFNLAGQEVGFYNKGKLSSGQHSINWNAGNLPSGVYFYKITAGDYSAIKKCILIK